MNEQVNKEEERNKRRNKSTNGGGCVWNSLLILLLLSVIILCVESGNVVGNERVEDETVNRINHRVIFNYIGKIKPTTMLIRHTFKIGLPMKKHSEDAEFMEKLDIMSYNKHVCGQEREDGQSQVHTFCQKFLKNFEFLKEVSTDGSIQIKRLIQDIYESVPLMSTSKFKQNKRAILSFVGDAMHSLFGVPAQEDIDILNTNVLKLTETINHDLGIMKKTVTDLSNYAEATTQRLDSLVKQMKDEAIQTVNYIQNIVQRQNSIIDFLTILL